MATLAAVRRISLKSRKADHEGRMTLVEHLRELRSRVLKSALMILVATSVCLFVAYEPIRRVITKPYCNVPEKYRIAYANHTCSLIIHSPLDGFTFRLKIALIAATVISSPVWLWQIWRFVTPGLKKNEKRYGLSFVVSSTVLFALGAVLSYVVLGRTLLALLSFGGPGVTAQLTADSYLSFVMAMLLAFGCGFEFPLIVLLLNFAGVLPNERLRKWRRVAFFLCVLFSAFAVPSNDPFSMLFLAIPLCVMYEGTIVIARLHDRAKRRRDETQAYAQLDDDETSPLELNDIS